MASAQPGCAERLSKECYHRSGNTPVTSGQREKVLPALGNEITALALSLLKINTHRPAVKSALLVTFLTASSKLLGFIRELLIAHHFGAQSIADAYRVGETISTVSASLLAHPFEVIALPLIVEQLVNKKETRARQVFVSLFTLAGTCAAILAIIILATAPVLVRIFAPKLPSDTARIATQITRIMALVPAAIVLISATGAYYNARRRFALPRLIDPAINTTAIILFLLTVRYSGITALAGAWTSGHIIGTLVALLPLIPLLARGAGAIRRGMLSLINSVTDPAIKEFFKLSLPLLALFLVRPLNLALTRAFASSLPPGNIAILAYADRLFAFPCSLITAAIGTIFFARASELATTNNIRTLRFLTNRLLGYFALTFIPASLLLIPIARPLVKLLYQHGNFTSTATSATALTLTLLGLGLFPFTATTLLTAGFRGRKDTLTPVIATILGAVTTAGFASAFVQRWGVPALALGSTLGITVNMLVLLIIFLRNPSEGK